MIGIVHTGKEFYLKENAVNVEISNLFKSYGNSVGIEHLSDLSKSLQNYLNDNRTVFEQRAKIEDFSKLEVLKDFVFYLSNDKQNIIKDSFPTVEFGEDALLLESSLYFLFKTDDFKQFDKRIKYSLKCLVHYIDDVCYVEYIPFVSMYDFEKKKYINLRTSQELKEFSYNAQLQIENVLLQNILYYDYGKNNFSENNLAIYGKIKFIKTFDFYDFDSYIYFTPKNN